MGMDSHNTSLFHVARKDVSDMKINSSAVAMNSSRTYSLEQKSTVASMTFAARSQMDLLNQSDESKDSEKTEDKLSISEEAKRLSEELQRQREESRKAEAANQAEDGTGRITDKDEMLLETLRKMLELLRNLKKGGNAAQADSLYQSLKSMKGVNPFASAGTQGSVTNLTGLSAGKTLWTRQTYASSFMSEKECTTFASTGVAKTEDGREISFHVDLSMSREFMQKSESFTEQTGYFFTDPLVVNLSGNPASLSDQKFFFDLDADGKEEQISSLNSGSGFLALDKNGDGTINDGNELFGTKSGDGFADLAAYDKDQNGWIDENDSVWNDLKIWTKNEKGEDQLLSLKEAGVGAFFTGKADTQFSLNNENNETNGMIRSTGVFLMENGAAGTLQHVDLVV